MSAAFVVSPPRSVDDVDPVRDLVKQAIAASESLDLADPRIFAAQKHLLAAFSELIRYQHGIGGPR